MPLHVVPPQHRAKLHSINPLERLNGEIKRRTGVVGIFPTDDTITPRFTRRFECRMDRSAA